MCGGVIGVIRLVLTLVLALDSHFPLDFRSIAAAAFRLVSAAALVPAAAGGKLI